MGKNVLLLYNPGAGHGQHDADDLVKAIEAAGHNCQYKSVKKKGWDDIPEEIDWLAVAGGDGTVRKAILRIQNRGEDEPVWPVGILPFGTANNVATSLGCDGTTAQLIQSWGMNSTRFNTATVKQGKRKTVLCEAMGFGLFAQHIIDMTKNPLDESLSPQEKVKAECEVLLNSLENFEPANYQVEMDGFRQRGDFLLLQVMNIRMLGPNLLLAPQAQPGDGLLDVVAFTEDDRPKLREYLQKRIGGEQTALQVETVRAKKVVINSGDKRYHVEDELFENDPSDPVEIVINNEPLHFFVPAE